MKHPNRIRLRLLAAALSLSEVDPINETNPTVV